MNFRYLLFIAILVLSACDGSESSAPPVETTSTFAAQPATTIDSDALGKQIALAVQNALLARGDTKVPDEKVSDLLAAVLQKLGPDAGKGLSNNQLAEQIASALSSVLDQRDATAKLEAKRLTDAAKWKAANEQADKLKSEGKQVEAQEILDATYYDMVAAEEQFVSDPNQYKGYSDSALPLSAVDERPSVKRHKMTIGGKTVWFTAKSGHLIAFAPKDPKNPGRKDAQASIFYTAYTRDDLPAKKRPVTFFFNGGPGSSSIWLHLSSWGPQRLVTDAPNIPAEYAKEPPDHFPMVGDEETLLDRSDLVFVDPVGSGFSEAIEPHENRQFWDMDADAKVNVDFVRRYVNVNNRQASPKYLYGESYGGIRVPIMARIMTEAGSTNYDPSGGTPIALTGMVLNSPILDYSIAEDSPGKFPTLAMTADFYGAAKARGTSTADDFVYSARRFGKDRYRKNYPLFADQKKWSEYIATPDGATYLDELYRFTGVGGCDSAVNPPIAQAGTGIFSGGCYLAENPWATNPDMGPQTVLAKLMPERQFNPYDLRMNASYDPSEYEHLGFTNAIKPYLRDYVNYMNESTYEVIPSDPYWNWKYSRDSSIKYWKSSITDLIITMTHVQKLLIIGGYHDVVTPFFQTELDLEASGIEKIFYTVKWFDGGHMTYLTEASRAPMKKTLDDFYAAPHYLETLCCRVVN